MYDSLIEQIKGYIKANNTHDISGDGLQFILLNIIANVGKGVQFLGIVTPDFAPEPTLDCPALALGFESGNYESFETVLANGEIGIFYFNGTTWENNKYTIPDGAIGTDQIADAAITENKIEDAAITENKIEDGAVTENKIEDGAVTENKVADDAITENKIADDAVTENKIVDGAVTENKIVDDAVTENKIADGAVSESKIADAAVTENKIADDSISESKIKDDAVTENKIADAAVTANKLDDSVKEQIVKGIAEGYKLIGVVYSEEDNPISAPDVSGFIIVLRPGDYTAQYGLTVTESDGVCLFVYNVAAETPVWEKWALGLSLLPERKEFRIKAVEDSTIEFKSNGSEMTPFNGLTSIECSQDYGRTWEKTTISPDVAMTKT